MKLVADCSANIGPKIYRDVAYVPLKVVTAEKEYVDTPELELRFEDL